MMLQGEVCYMPVNRRFKKKITNIQDTDFETNLLNKGLISADRSTKATLLLTIPRSKFKSSAKDLSTPIFEIEIQG
ncbi:hypothetical protein Glove_382g69 [Diversispora epigaea]|uniref:Uncharacterized protein n=1 Tax=Diversispora epigaea TaxID=1348612 RepID=A0A397H7G8_9GLOM|nr:hypothetical protein Glove_382g69 [Diversispora epigaea]